jgi:hypothetical protein
MKKRILALCLLLAATGCGPQREAADARLSKTCLAIVKGLYNNPEDSVEPKDTVFQSMKSHDNTNVRVVNIHAIYIHEHGAMQEKDYACAFEEGAGLFGYKASFFRITFDGKKYGNFDGTMEGDLEVLVKINDIAHSELQ